MTTIRLPATGEVLTEVADTPLDGVEDEAVALANDTKFGLPAGLSKSVSGRVHRMARDIHAGMIWLNTYRIVHDMVPGGAYGQSGYGSEGGLKAFGRLTRNKSVWTAMHPGLPAGYPRI